jgi:hypothetical protein
VSGGEGSLGLFDFTTEFLNGAVVLAEILALLLLVQLDKVLHDALIEVLTTYTKIRNVNFRQKSKSETRNVGQEAFTQFFKL